MSLIERLLKRLPRLSLTFGQTVTLLLASLVALTGTVTFDAVREGLTPRTMIGSAILVGLLTAAGMLIYQERRSWRLLRQLRSTLEKVAPGYEGTKTDPDRDGSDEAVRREIHVLSQRWQEFCEHCQRVHDAEMVQAEHLATTGELAAGVAHEIRNPLAGIAGAIEIIARDFPATHPDREIMEDLRQEVKRIEKVLNDLLAYARPRPPQFQLSNLQEAVARTIQLARQQIGNKKIEFSTRFARQLPPFCVDPEQIQQVLLNLVLNSIHAIDQQGKIEINVSVSEAHQPGQFEAVEIQIGDTGRGIPPEHLERIFRPFYTTRRRGTGLGLSLVRRIVGQHGGTIRVESELNRGTRFTIRLPVREPVREASLTHAQ